MRNKRILYTIFYHTLALVIGLILSFFVLFISGNLQDVYIYYELYENAYINYLMFVSLLVLGSTLSQYYFWSRLFFRKVSSKAFIVAGIVAYLVGLFTAIFGNHSGSIGWGTSFLYIFSESTIAPLIGISFFHMDWSGWTITFTLYFVAIFSAPYLLLFNEAEKRNQLSSTRAAMIPLCLFVYIFIHAILNNILGIFMIMIDLFSLLGIFIIFPYILCCGIPVKLKQFLT